MTLHDQAVNKLRRSATEAVTLERAIHKRRSMRRPVLVDLHEVDVVLRIAFIFGVAAGAAVVGASLCLLRCV